VRNIKESKYYSPDKTKTNTTTPNSKTTTRMNFMNFPMHPADTFLNLDCNDPELLDYPMTMQQQQHYPCHQQQQQQDYWYPNQIQLNYVDHHHNFDFVPNVTSGNEDMAWLIQEEEVFNYTTSASTTTAHCTTSEPQIQFHFHQEQQQPRKQRTSSSKQSKDWVWIAHQSSKSQFASPQLVETKNIYQKKQTPFDKMVTKMSFKN
jgi:hypothetical protein